MIIGTDFAKKCLLLLAFSSMTLAVVAQEEAKTSESAEVAQEAEVTLDEINALMPESLETLEAANQPDDFAASFGDFEADEEDPEDVPFVEEQKKEVTAS